MRSMICAVIIGIMLITGGILHCRYIDKTAISLTDENNKVITAIENNNFENAMQHIKTLDEKISEKSLMLSSTDNHSQLQDIKKTLSELKTYTDQQDIGNALAKAKILNVMFENLPGNYTVCIENIL